MSVDTLPTVAIIAQTTTRGGAAAIRSTVHPFYATPEGITEANRSSTTFAECFPDDPAAAT